MRYPLAIVLLALAASSAQAVIFNGNVALNGNVAGMQVLYELNIDAVNQAYRNGTPVPYSIDNSGSIPNGSYTRIGYYVEVTQGTQAGEFVYVEMDSFDSNAASLGLPHNVDNPVARQTIVTNADIVSNNASIVTGTGIGTVNLEMWPSGYQTTGTSAIPGPIRSQFDLNDGNFGIGAGHGSFQIHNHGAGQTLFGWSDWGGNSPGAPSEFGIGNATLLGEPHPDWTFSDRGQSGLLQIVVNTGIAIPEPTTATLGLIGLAGLMVRRRRAA